MIQRQQFRQAHAVASRNAVERIAAFYRVLAGDDRARCCGGRQHRLQRRSGAFHHRVHRRGHRRGCTPHGRRMRRQRAVDGQRLRSGGKRAGNRLRLRRAGLDRQRGRLEQRRGLFLLDPRRRDRRRFLDQRLLQRLRHLIAQCREIPDVGGRLRL